jgi:hypothetical protein
MLPAAFGDLPSAYFAGQGYVGDQNLGETSTAPSKCLLSVNRMYDVKALIAQRLHEKLANEWVIPQGHAPPLPST